VLDALSEAHDLVAVVAGGQIGVDVVEGEKLLLVVHHRFQFGCRFAEQILPGLHRAEGEAVLDGDVVGLAAALPLEHG